MSNPKRITSVADLTPDPRNANRGTERGTGAVEHSLRTYGAGRSILAARDGTVIAGNKTLESAAALGIPVRVVETDGTELVVVQRMDMDSGSRESVELGIADNRASEVGLEWDADVLAQLQDDGIDLGAFWHEGELKALLGGDDEPIDDGDVLGAPDAPLVTCPECGHQWRD